MKKRMTGLAILGLVLGLARHTSAETLPRLMALADSLSNVENSDSSIAVRLKALEMARRQYGTADSTVAEILELIAVEHYYISQFSESETYYARALKIREAVHGPNHPRTARCLTRLGVIQDELTKYDQAVASFERAIAIADANSATDPSELAFCLDNLAAAYRHTGDFERAANAAERAVSLTAREETEILLFDLAEESEGSREA